MADKDVSFHILASGSGGNSALLCVPDVRLLIDCGISARSLVLKLNECGLSTGDITGIVISHAHGDHVRGINGFQQTRIRSGYPPVDVYVASPKVVESITVSIDEHPWKFFEPGIPQFIGSVKVDPFTVPHDAEAPTAFTFRIQLGASGEGCLKIGFATDLGRIPPAMLRKFSDCQVIVIESNYDEQMLAESGLPGKVQGRTSGPGGHLSNRDVAELLKVLTDKTTTVVLSHISTRNNTPGLARESALRALGPLRSQNVELLIADQKETLRVF